MNDWPVARKLGMAFGILTLLVFIVAAMSLRSLYVANDSFASYIHGIDARARAAQNIRNAVDARAIAARDIVLTNDPRQLEIETAAVNIAQKKVADNLSVLNALTASAVGMTEDARSSVAKVGEIESRYAPVAAEIVRLGLSGQTAEATRQLNERCIPLLTELQQATDHYIALTLKRQIAMVDASENSYREHRDFLLGIAVFSVLSAIAAGWLISKSLASDLGTEPALLRSMAQRIAQGDLRPSNDFASAPPSSVSASMGEMRAGLADVVTQVHASALSIALGAAAIAEGNTDLASRTEEQAASLQETAASMEQITATVKLNSLNAAEVSTLAAEAAGIADHGNQSVRDVAATMNEISERSDKIAEIISIIEGIAFQTNILALNAAVEAARAGEQGRGFAVVAGEVRSLALRSAGASKDIKNLIEGSLRVVARGAILASQADETMKDVTKAIVNVKSLMSEIAAASDEQTRGIEQVNLAIAQMDEVTQRNAALVDAASAASNSLKQQGQQLNDAVKTFQIT